eukprot:TRINITY_DN23187_c0_g1_i2.p1 TRINITY_DN23187_c0_g1~~TRINITY_DN23187_c0_g1_i2.p1  ORF type:complete len:146 (+),score=4.23 TRINITY_DN23187_c0_g1_i2:554-991(+)
MILFHSVFRVLWGGLQLLRYNLAGSAVGDARFFPVSIPAVKNCVGLQLLFHKFLTVFPLTIAYHARARGYSGCFLLFMIFRSLLLFKKKKGLKNKENYFFSGNYTNFSLFKEKAPSKDCRFFGKFHQISKQNLALLLDISNDSSV